MSLMDMTLEVLKLSGWLKADAYCRVQGRACDAGGRGARREAGGPGVWWRHDKRHAREKARLKAWGPRARAERTRNMWLMSVTLEVSKLSGWLKADADCRVQGRAWDAGGRGASREAGAWAWGVVAAHKGHARGMARLKAWGQKARAESARRTCGSWS